MIYIRKLKYPIKNNGIWRPKLVNIALSELKYPANDQPIAPLPYIKIFSG